MRPCTIDRAIVRTKRMEIRVREDQRRRWQQAARKAGLSLSAWMRATLDRNARM